MPTGDTLTPTEAARIATNSYFTLKDWISNEPTAGVESRQVISNRVLGNANVGASSHGNTSLKGTDMATSKLGRIHEAETGLGTSSGFGYTLTYDGNGQKHVVVATRGTRPELPGYPDLITDLRAGMIPFGSFGQVHKGFKKTFDTLLPSLKRDKTTLDQADVIHCVGHSLGGGVATLVAGHLANAGKNVRLYTFGCPRVGAFATYQAFEQKIGPANIYRVAHDLDPISLIAPYPYIHIHPRPSDSNNMTLLSPTGKLFSTANHDMMEYIKSVNGLDWAGVRSQAALVEHDNALVARWLLHEGNDPGWVSYASAKTLSLLFKLFSHTLKNVSTVVLLSLSALDLMVEILMKGLNKAKEMGSQVLQLLKYAAQWAGIKVAEAADFTASIIKAILEKMLTTMKELAMKAYKFATRYALPITLGMAGGWALAHYMAL